MGIGGGHSHLEETMSVLGVPVMTPLYEYSSKPVQKNDLLVPSYYAYKFYLAQPLAA